MAQELRIGTSGWTYKEWRGVFYPEKLPQKQWFEFYAHEFSTVEINYSFYRWPSEAAVAGWREHAPAGFVYTLKAPRSITHFSRLGADAERMVYDFYALTGRLGNTLGCHLFQLPPSFKLNPENRDRVERFLTWLKPELCNTIEFRHASWWNPDIYKLFRKHRAIFCVVSGHDMPPEPVVTAKTAYFRFHGSRGGRYTPKEMRDWVAKIRKCGARRVFCYFNNDWKAYAVENAMMLKKELEK